MLRNEGIGSIEIDELNRALLRHPAETVAACEERLDGKLREIAEEIADNTAAHKIIMLSGPSNAGKTTSSHKLCHMLEESGVRTHIISLDDFFLSKDEIPLDENGVPDVESPAALNGPLMERCFASLAAGEETQLPRFDFASARSMPDGARLRITEHEIVLVEGIHALNDRVLAHVPGGRMFRIYLSVRTNFTDGGRTFLRKRHVRLSRRIVRDNSFRGTPPEGTFRMWEGVCRGEEKWIIPFSGRADVILDTILGYEPAVIGAYLIPLLTPLCDHPEYGETARMLIAKYQAFAPIAPELVPPTSLLREFIGGSIYSM